MNPLNLLTRRTFTGQLLALPAAALAMLKGNAAPPLPLPGLGSAAVANVRDFGALGNGTDDYAPIQAAIDYGTPLGLPIYFPSGTYSIGSELRTNRSTRLMAEGMLSRIRALPSFQFSGPESAMIHQYRDTLPVLYATAGPTERLYLDRLTIDGANVPGANGVLCSMQQPAAWNNVRVENCPGYGVALCDTVQAVFTNLMIIHCGVGLQMRSASLCYFHGLDIEQSLDRHMVVDGIGVLGGGTTGASRWNSFVGVHFEPTLPGPGQHVCVDHYGPGPNTFVNVYAACATGETVFRFASVNGAEVRAPVYVIQNAAANGSTPSVTFLQDTDRGLTLNAFNDLRDYIPLIVAGNENPPQGNWPGKNDVTAVRRGGQVVRL